jgi:hypothetical protein
MPNFLDKVKSAGKGVVDAGAKTMLKVRTIFLRFVGFLTWSFCAQHCRKGVSVEGLSNDLFFVYINDQLAWSFFLDFIFLWHTRLAISVHLSLPY